MTESDKRKQTRKMVVSDQSQRFIRTARELGCDEDPEAFKRMVEKLAKAPPAPRERQKKAQDKRE